MGILAQFYSVLRTAGWIAQALTQQQAREAPAPALFNSTAWISECEEEEAGTQADDRQNLIFYEEVCRELQMMNISDTIAICSQSTRKQGAKN